MEDEIDVIKPAELAEVECAEFSSALEIQDIRPDEAIALYKQVISKVDGAGVYAKFKEEAIYNLGSIYAKQKRTKDLSSLIVEIRPFFAEIPKAKTAKIVRKLIDLVGDASDDLSLQATLCQESIEWCIREKRTFLKQRLQSRMADLCLKLNKFKEALHIIAKLIREVKRFDDKLLMVEVFLVESRVHQALQNLPKSKGALTAARSNANAIYCPPLLQAQIDMQAGVLSAEERDFKTAFSYFYEAFEGYNTINSPKLAVLNLKYMLLSKVMVGSSEDVYSIVNGKAGVKYAGIEVEAMRAVADAYKRRSIEDFAKVHSQFHEQLAADPIIATHLDQLRSNLLEQNLARIIEPYEVVQVARIAELIKLPLDYIEAKLSEMILDKKLRGILDQSAGNLIIFAEMEADKTYATGLETLQGLGEVVDKLYSKAKKLI